MADSFEMQGSDDDDDLYVSDSETEFFSINTDDTSSSDEGVELTNDVGQVCEYVVMFKIRTHIVQA